MSTISMVTKSKPHQIMTGVTRKLAQMGNQKAGRKLTVSNAIVALAIIVCFNLAYFPVWKRLLTFWIESEDYSHGFLILPISLYILWRKRYTLEQIPKKPSPWGISILGLSLLVYIFSEMAGIFTVASTSMLVTLAGIIVYMQGFGTLRTLSFPLLLLVFMIPIPAQIYSKLTIPLQLFVSDTSAACLYNVGVSLYQEGNVIQISGKAFQVVQACSGLRSLVSLLAIGGIYGHFTLKSNALRVILFLAAVPAAIIVNIIRVTVLVAARYYLNMDLTTGAPHTALGGITFFMAFALIVGLKEVLTFWDVKTS